jgi:hypothetical protein
VSYDPSFGSPLLIVNRRGFNGDEPDRTRGELRAFLQRLRTEPPAPEEIGQAAVNLARTYWLPPYSGGEDALRESPVLLFSRAATLAAAWSHSWPADFGRLVQNVDVATVRKLAVEMIAPERLAWATLVPDPSRGLPEKR